MTYVEDCGDVGRIKRENEGMCYKNIESKEGQWISRMFPKILVSSVSISIGYSAQYTTHPPNVLYQCFSYTGYKRIGLQHSCKHVSS